MSETPKPQHCGKCGAALSGYAPDGLCAACLLESAFEPGDARVDVQSKPAPLLSFNDYELLVEIARGGMGVIYRARQISLNRIVAIKMILGGHLANAADMQRFRAEAETAAQLQHPNIVAIHEVGEHAGQPFFSMDLVEGRNLAQFVRDEPLPSRKAASYLKTIAESVHYAHSRGVLHRDLKPSNILIDESDQPRITDFGLAKRFTSDAQLSTNDPHLTQSGQVLGSPSFIPPEQAGGGKYAIGPASDVYSLGAILYHCLTARPPFVAETMTATLRMVAENEPVSPRLLNASVPRDLETICLKCLEKDPERRYATAQELADEIGRFLRDEPIRARPASQAEKAWRWCRRKPALASTIALVLVLLFVVGIGSSVAAFRISRERRQAEANGKRAQAMADFLASMLEAVGPSKALGRDTTMLREILDKTAERVGKDLKDEPEAEADVRMVLGKTYAELSLYANALEMANEALRLRQQHFGNEHILVADALAAVAAFRLYRDDLLGAEKANREALAMRRKFLGNNHTNVATSLNNLSLAVGELGKLEEAETYQSEALEIRKRLLGNTNLDVGRSLANLAMVQWIRGNFAGAETRMAEALKVFRSQVGDVNPDTASLQNNLASMLGKKGELDEAEALHRKTLEVRRRLLNGQHANIAYSLTQLAVVLSASGQLDEAQTNLLEALDMGRKLSLGDHSNVGDTLWALGMVVAKKGNLAAAETNLLESLELRKKLLGAKNPDVAEALDALAIVTAMRGDRDRANEMLVEAMEINKEQVNLIPVLYHLGWVLRQQGEVATADARRSEALMISSKHGVYGAWPFLLGIYDLTDILQTQGKFTEAEALLADAADYAQNNPDAGRTLQRDTFQRLARFYETWDRSNPNTGKAGQAGDWRKKLEGLEQHSTPKP